MALARDELRDELRSLQQLQLTVAQEVRDLGHALRQDVKLELQKALATVQGSSSGGPEQPEDASVKAAAAGACVNGKASDMELAAQNSPQFLEDPLHGMMEYEINHDLDQELQQPVRIAVTISPPPPSLRLAGNVRTPTAPLAILRDASDVDEEDVFPGVPQPANVTKGHSENAFVRLNVPLDADSMTSMQPKEPKDQHGCRGCGENLDVGEYFCTFCGTRRGDMHRAMSEVNYRKKIASEGNNSCLAFRGAETDLDAYAPGGPVGKISDHNRKSRHIQELNSRKSAIRKSAMHNPKYPESHLTSSQSSDALGSATALRDSQNGGCSSNAAGFSMKKSNSEAARKAATRRDERKSSPQALKAAFKSGELTFKQVCLRAFKSERFDYLMGVFLFLNAGFMGVATDVQASMDTEESPTAFRIIDGIFCFVFVFELTVRLCVYGRQEFFFGPDWNWNVFDCIVVFFQVLDEFSKAFLTGTAVQESIDSLGVLRMLRLARIMRLIRMVRLIPELKSMVYLITASMQAFLWTVVLLLILIYCVAVYYVEVAADIVRNKKVDEEGLESLKNSFGSIGTSVLSLFMAITGGDDWRNFVDVFKSLDSGLGYLMHSFMFSVYIAFATLVMLNLVTGVFVDGAQRMIQEEKDVELVKAVEDLFSITDVDFSGQLSFEEFESCMEGNEQHDLWEMCGLEGAEARSIFRLIDTNRSGDIDMTEFVQGCIRLRGPARSVDLSALKHDFVDQQDGWSRQFSELNQSLGMISCTISQIAEHLEPSRHSEYQSSDRFSSASQFRGPSVMAGSHTEGESHLN